MRKAQRKPKKMRPVKKRRFVEEAEDLDETDKDEIPDAALGGAKT
jgi:hypothetical protein